MSIVSRDFEICFSGDWNCMVRVLCSRSAILIRMTRMSRLMAMNILRRFSICCSSSVEYSTRVSLVTPSTSAATVAPNCLAISS